MKPGSIKAQRTDSRKANRAYARMGVPRRKLYDALRGCGWVSWRRLMLELGPHITPDGALRRYLRQLHNGQQRHNVKNPRPPLPLQDQITKGKNTLLREMLFQAVNTGQIQSQKIEGLQYYRIDPDGEDEPIVA